MNGQVAARRAPTIPPGEPDAEHRRHVVTALVIDRPGTLNRVSGLLRARSFNIESLTVGNTHVLGQSRMTIVLRGDEGHLRQVLAQLERLIEVLDVHDLHAASDLELELAIVEAVAPPASATAEELETAIGIAGGAWIRRGPDGWWARLVAAPPAIDQSIERLRSLGLRNLVRAGSVALGSSRADDVATARQASENGASRA